MLNALPNEVLYSILPFLNTIDLYELSKSCKELWYRIRFFHLDKVYKINHKQKLGSFFMYNITSIAITVDRFFIYTDLKTAYNYFSSLSKIYIQCNNYLPTKKQVQRIMNSISGMDRTVKVYVDQKIKHLFIEVAPLYRNIKIKPLPMEKKSNQQVAPPHQTNIMDRPPVKSKRSFPKEATESTESWKRACRSPRVPSPVRNLIANITSELHRFEEEMKIPIPSTSVSTPVKSTVIKRDGSNSYPNNIQKKKSIIPTQLKQITNQRYKELILNEPPFITNNTKKNDIDELMNDIAPQLIESIIKNDSCWYYITQVELYVKDSKHVDDCALEQQYPITTAKSKAIIQNKSYKGTVWNELSIYWGKFEFLVTGGLAGTINEIEGISAFLGPALPIILPSSNNNNNEMKIFTRINSPNIIQRERRLRNYGKSSSNYKWSYHSSSFSNNGFISTHPLYLNLPTGSSSALKASDKRAKLYSFLISKVLSKNITQKEIDTAINLYKSSTGKLSNFNHNNQNLTIEQLYKNKNSSTPIENIMINILYKLKTSSSTNPVNILTNEDIVSLYNTRMSSYCKTKDINIIKKKLYLTNV